MPRALRQGRNMSVFRDVNERIAELGLDAPGGLQEFICECSHLGCAAHVLLPVSVYAAIREIPDAFLVIPGHEDREHEEVLACESQYFVVRATRSSVVSGRADPLNST